MSHCRTKALLFHLRLCFALISCVLVRTPSFAQPVERVDNTTLYGKLIMGYQGWFACPVAGSKLGWAHWKTGNAFTIDMLPDTSELSASEKCDSGLTTTDGQPIFLYDSANAQTVDRHFAWMKQYGLPGVALQKFGSVISRPESQARADDVLRAVKQAAERHGRVFFLMYDLSGLSDQQLDGVVEDWKRLNATSRIGGDAYLRHRGRPVLGLWGLGFARRPLGPVAIKGFINKLRNASEARGGVTILAGVPASWRLGQNDASNDESWKDVWPMLDVISPWTVGRYADDRGADNYRDNFLKPDLAATKAIGVDYMPVIFPGFSWANLMHARREDQRAIPNQIARRCGNFYWRQAGNALQAGASMIYNAMFDEVDEGTAMFKLAPFTASALAHPSFVSLDADGCTVANDWYLRLAGIVGNAIASASPLPRFMPSPR